MVLRAGGAPSLLSAEQKRKKKKKEKKDKAIDTINDHHNHKLPQEPQNELAHFIHRTSTSSQNKGECSSQRHSIIEQWKDFQTHVLEPRPLGQAAISTT
jgi:hypothetical protein